MQIEANTMFATNDFFENNKGITNGQKVYDIIKYLYCIVESGVKR